MTPFHDYTDSVVTHSNLFTRTHFITWTHADLAALRDLQKKPLLREKYGIEEHMVLFDVVPIIDIPGTIQYNTIQYNTTVVLIH